MSGQRWHPNETAVRRLVVESNHIEGIDRDPYKSEIEETAYFLVLDGLTVPDVQRLVSTYQSGAALRVLPGMDVRVGRHVAPAGGAQIGNQLGRLLSAATAGAFDAYVLHIEYEMLHPFMDGNGRSGRAIWAWQMARHEGGFPLGFLHHFYYQTLLARSLAREAFAS